MKSIFCIPILIATSVNCIFGQANLEKGKYFPVQELRKIEGTWSGSTKSSDSLVIELKSSKEFLKGPDIYTDQLTGTYTYYKNGQLVSKSSNDSSLKSGSIKSSQNSETAVITFIFYDNVKDKLGDLKLELTALDSKDARWILRNQEVKVINGFYAGKPWDPGFSVPTEMTLRKLQ
jgi:hypothetical protein